MKIILGQNEIEVALTEYISNQGISIKGKHVEIDMTAGRGVNGFTAELNINNNVRASSIGSAISKAVEAVPEVKKAVNQAVTEENGGLFN